MAVDTKLTDLATATTFSAGSWFLLVDPGVTTMDDSGTDLKVQAGNLINGLLPSQAGNATKVLSTDGAGALSWATAATGSGTVTTVSVAAANGFGGSVATATTTPAITITTSITGILKGNGTAISAATSGTDYEPPITAGSTAQYLKGDKSLGTLNQAAVAGLTTASSPTFAGLTVGTLAGLLKASTGTLAAAVSGTDYEPPITAGTTSQYLKGDKSLGTLNQAAVAGLTAASSPAFAGLTVGALGGLLKATSGVVSAATAGTDYLTTSYAGTSSIVTVGTITSGTWTGTTIAVANGGTGQTSAANAINALLPTQTSNSGKFLTTNGTIASWGSPAGSGTVTSVDMTVPSWLAVAGNPVTGSGTLAVTAATGQAANLVVATPDGTTGAVSLRSLTANDIPNHSTAKLTSGQLAAARGGTGVDSSAAANGALPIGNGSGFTLANLTAGTGIGITNSAGGIAIAQTPFLWQALSALTAVSNTAAQASLLAGGTSLGSLTIPGNSLVAGVVFRWAFSGTLSSAAAQTMTISIYLGSTQVFSTAALTQGATTGTAWSMESGKCGLIVQAIGVGGKVYGITQYNPFGGGTAQNMMTGTTSGTAAPSQVTVDTTASLAFDLRAQWGGANASNSIQVLGGWIRLEGP